MTDQALTFELGERGHWLLNGTLGGRHNIADPKVYNIEGIEPEISQVVMHSVDQLLPGSRMRPRLVGATTRAQFSDNHEALRVGMQRLFNKLIGHMGTVVITGVDVIDTGFYRLAQNGYRSVNIA